SLRLAVSERSQAKAWRFGTDRKPEAYATGYFCLFQTHGADAPIGKVNMHRAAVLAMRIRTRTSVPNAWIAEQLHLGHVSRLNQCARLASPDLLQKLEAALGNWTRF